MGRSNHAEHVTGFVGSHYFHWHWKCVYRILIVNIGLTNKSNKKGSVAQLNMTK